MRGLHKSMNGDPTWGLNGAGSKLQSGQFGSRAIAVGRLGAVCQYRSALSALITWSVKITAQKLLPFRGKTVSMK